MGAALGPMSIMGCAKETTWGLSVAPTDRLLLLSESLDYDYQHAMHDYMHGSPAMPGMQRTFEPVGGGIDLAAAYDQKNGAAFVGFGLPLALAMGLSTWDGGNSSNQIEFQDNLARFGSFAWDKFDASDPWEAVSCMVNSFTLSCEMNGYMKLSLDVQGHNLHTDNSAVATVANLDALPADLPFLILFNHFVCRIGDQANILAATDEIPINSFEITVNNNLTDPQQTTDDNSTYFGALRPIQPVRNGKREVSITIKLPRYENDTLRDFGSNETGLQMTLESTEGNNSHEFDIILPNLKVEAPEAPLGGATALEQTIKFKALQINAGQTYKPLFKDSSAVTGEMAFETVDDRTASHLA